MKAFLIQGHAAEGWELWSAGDQPWVPGRRWLLQETDPERRQRLQPGCGSGPADVGCCQLRRGGGRSGGKELAGPRPRSNKRLVCHRHIALPRRPPSLRSAIATRVKIGSGLPCARPVILNIGLGLALKMLTRVLF